MVLLTVYYMVATGVQSWRLRTLYQKIGRVLDGKGSVVFLKKSDGTSDGITAALVSSDLCVNSSDATVSDCFWSNEVSQGISVAPKQLIYLNPFVSFPQPPGLIPFSVGTTDAPESSRGDAIYVLLESDLLPTFNREAPAIEIEAFGKLVAWKVDTRLAMVVKTNARCFSQLILSTFLQNNYMLNDYLPLVRAQTVSVEGTPQDFDEIVSHSRKDIAARSSVELSDEGWEKHFEGIKNLSVLANQATEFEIKKNLTEGKTGIVQPDLISSKNIEESLLHVVTSPDTPKKKMLSLEKTDNKIKGLKVELQRQELLKSPVNPTASFPKTPDNNGHIIEQKIVTPESPKFPSASPAKSPTPSVRSRVSNEPQSPKFPTGSPLKKPSVLDGDKPSVVKMEPKVVTVKTPQKVVNVKPLQEAEIVKPLHEAVTVKPLQEAVTVKPLPEAVTVKPLQEAANVKPPQEATITKKPVKVATADLLASEKQFSAPFEVKKPAASPTKPKPPNLPPIAAPEPQPAPPKLAPSKSSHSIRRKRQKLSSVKPPNVLVFSDSLTTRDNVIKTLGTILQRNVYTIYPLTAPEVRKRIWLDNTALLVVCGSVNGSDVGSIFLDFFFKGGKVLCLCSDLLRHVLPSYHTAEVREHELVQFSYGKWKNIKMMHHIFCYQPSPVRKHFSQESDEPPKERPSSGDNPSVELRDEYGVAHNIRVQTLGTEDTWKTPSLLLVYTDNGGKIVFSQIHLEVDPSLYENDDLKYPVLMKNEGLRHEIFGDVLSTHLGLNVNPTKEDSEKLVTFTRGYFLGRHELKFEVLEQLKTRMETANTLKLDNLTVKFCGKNVDPPTPEATCLPIMIHTCPDDFSTLDYFDCLKAEHVGRLLIYSKTLVSSTVLVNNVKYVHGFAVIPRELLSATGRGNNKWCSPLGCLMFSLQLHIPLSSPLGQRIPLLQHLTAVAVVMAVQKLPGYEDIDLGVKWPNDIYANSDTKIGGLIVTSLMEGDTAICNIGLGVNLSNSIPTTCINDMIAAYNKKNSKNLPALTYERALALIFNEIESILDRVQSGDIQYLYDLYYKCWLHGGSNVTVLTANNQEKHAKILGIDDFGYLKIQLDDTKKIESVQPDGNSFDMLRGLIVPKSQ